MNLIKTFATAALAATCALGAGLAQAGSDVRWSVSIGAPLFPVYSQPAPVYVEPAPVSYRPAPRPVYVEPGVYGRPADGYGYREPTRWDRDADGVPDRYERHGHRRHWDSDRDGVPDRYDRRPENPYRR